MTDETELGGFDPDCEQCQGDGYLDLYTDHLEQSVAQKCPSCEARLVTIAPRFADVDEDGWTDGVVRVPAKYTRKPRAVEKIDTIVIHRLWKGKWDAGPRYVSNPTKRHPETGKVIPRYVSWHYTIHKPGWDRKLTQHASYLTHCHHAPPLNGTSVGQEFDGPFGGLWHPESIKTSVEIIESLQKVLPDLYRIVSHRWVCPESRRDPGPKFPWEAYEHLGLKIVK